MGLLWACYGPAMPVVRASMLVGMGVAMGSHAGCVGVGHSVGLYTVCVGRYGVVMGLYFGGMSAVCRLYVGCMGLHGAVWGCSAGARQVRPPRVQYAPRSNLEPGIGPSGLYGFNIR